MSERPSRAVITDPDRMAAAGAERNDHRAAAGDSYSEVMSFGQQRLWVLDKLLPDRSVYNTPTVQRLIGPLDVPALETSIGEILNRHDVLRTRFVVIDGEPRQVIAPPEPLRLQVDDLSALSPDMREVEARRLAEVFCRVPFDLERGPLFTARLLRLGADQHWLLLNMHHIVTDHWSSSIFSR
jgi:hypothetical protein